MMKRSGRGLWSLSALLMAVALTGCSGPGSWFKRSEAPPPPRANDSTEGKRVWYAPWRKTKATHKPASLDPVTSTDVTPRDTQPPSEFTRATELVKAHKFEQAKGMLIDVLNKNPNHAEAYRWLGDCYYNLMELNDAIRAYSTARELDPQNYFALRGKGFSHLHLGHEHWRGYETALQSQNRDGAHQELSDAHESYKRALELLQQCLKLFAGDSEAMYGRAMAAEGASRKLYANAVGLLRKGKKTDAHAWAENCVEIIDEGIEAAKIRIREFPDRPGPRKLVGGLFFRRAMLLKQFGQNEQAAMELEKAAMTWQSILDDIDPNNSYAKRELERCRASLEKWRAAPAG